MIWRPALAAVLLALAGAAAAACDIPEGIKVVRADTTRGVNAQRAQAGLPALAPDADLTEAAQRHACDMAEHDKMSHTGSDGSKFGTRIKRTGYRYASANENVGMGFRTPAAAVGWWMESAPHRANILARGTQDIGIGVARAADGTMYWSMLSAQPR